MHDEPEVRLVETHAQRGRRDQSLHVVVQQRGLEFLPFRRVGLPGVGGDAVAAIREQVGQVVCRGHGEGVDDPRPGQPV